MKIMLVEDNKAIAEMLKNFFSLEKWETSIFFEGYEALENICVIKPDLIVLDWMLPTISGIELCKELKKINPSIPVLILTAKSEDSNEIEGFSSGADDYIRKPFNPKILLLRMNALLSRKKVEKLQITSDIYIDILKKKIVNKEEEIVVSPKEYELLLYLSENRGRYFSREQLIDYIWGFDFEGDSRTVDSHIANIRKKLKLESIKNKRGIGYSMEIKE